MPEAEAEFIARQEAILKRRMKRALNTVKRKGRHPHPDVEMTLEINRLIEFGPPSEVHPYNHFRLTSAGEAYLAS